MPKGWLLVIFGLVLAGLATMGVLSLRQDLTGILPQNDPLLLREAKFFASQGSTRVLVVEAVPKDGADYSAARSALLDLIPRLAPLGAKPPAAGKPEALALAAETIYAHLPELTLPETLAALEPELSPAALTTRLIALKERAQRPDDLFAGSAGRRDPLALGAKPLEEISGPAGATVDGPLFRNADGRHAMLLLEVDFAPDAVTESGLLIDSIAAVNPPHADLVVIGPYRHYVENTRTIWNDLIATLPLCLALVVIILRSQLGTWRTVAVVHLPALVGMVGALAGAGAWSVITGLTMPFALVGFADGFLGIAVDYGNHVASARRAGHRPVLPLIVTYLTTAAAFVVLLTSSVPALQFVAAMTITGLGTALLMTLWVMPDLLPPPGGRDRWLAISGPLYTWCCQHPWRRLALAAVITAAAAPGLTRLGFEEDIRRYDGSHPQTWRDLEAFTRRWSGGVGGGATIVANAPELDAALAAVAHARRTLNLPSTTIERLLPDAAEQHRRRLAWNAFWRKHDRFAADLRAACAVAGLRSTAFEPAIERYSPVPETGQPVTLEVWHDTLIATALDLQVTSVPEGGWQVASPVEPATRLDAARWNTVLGEGPAWVAHRGDLGARILGDIGRDLASRGPWVALAVALVIALSLRRIRSSLAVLAPPTVALIWTFGLLGWLGFPLTPFSLLAAAFILGIGIDSAVFLADGDESAFSPVIAVWVTTVIGVGSMALATHPVLRMIGISLVIGMTAAFFTSILITPAVMRVSRSPTV